MAPAALRDRPLEVLIVHPEPDARREIRDSLAAPGIVCREATSGAECLRAARSEPPDLLILDLYLPDQSGLGVCRLFRETPQVERVPIMVVSSQASEIDRVLAFESGADDFVPRPFYAAELRARVDAVIRGFRARTERQPPPARGLQIDLAAGRLSLEGTRIDLTPTERLLFAELVRCGGRVVRRKQLIERIWGGGTPTSERAIDAHVKSIRRKLGASALCIETVRGVGYRFVDSRFSNS